MCKCRAPSILGWSLSEVVRGTSETCLLIAFRQFLAATACAVAAAHTQARLQQKSKEKLEGEEGEEVSLIRTNDAATHVTERLARMEKEPARTRSVSTSWRDAMSPNAFRRWRVFRVCATSQVSNLSLSRHRSENITKRCFLFCKGHKHFLMKFRARRDSVLCWR